MEKRGIKSVKGQITLFMLIGIVMAAAADMMIRTEITIKGIENRYMAFSSLMDNI